jgi:hypothetical protein
MTNNSAKQIEALFRAKQNRRRELAKLPFEKKIKIPVELQQVASISNKRRRHKFPIWNIAS